MEATVNKSTKYSNALKRGLGYILITMAELLGIIVYQTKGDPQYFFNSIESKYIIFTAIGILLLWISVSGLYAFFKTGGKRVYIAGILGVFWPVPLLALMQWGTNAERITSDILTVIAFFVPPTLYFVLTEPGTKGNLRKSIYPFLKHTVCITVCIIALIHLFAAAPALTQQEAAQLMSFTVDQVQTKNKKVLIQARIINHTRKPIILKSPRAVVNGHPSSERLICCMCCSGHTLPNNMYLPAGEEVPVTLSFSHADITYGLFLTFESLSIGGKKHKSSFPGEDYNNIRADIP